MKHLLLLHGAIGAKDQLQPLAEKLKDHFRVHTINFSGHGGAPMPAIFSIEAFARDVLNYMDAEKLEKVNIFGYSMGGFVALYLAKHYPEKAEKVFTLATKFLWTPEIAAKEMKMLHAEKIADKIPAFAKTLEKRHAPNDWKTVLQKTADMMAALGNKNALSLPDYECIEQPVTIGIGDQDNMVTMEETTDVCGKLKNGKLMLFEDTAHPMEKVPLEKLASAIGIFMKA